MDNEVFAKGNVGKVLLRFAIPAMISLFVAELYNMVDTIFIGRVIGGNGIGALIVAFPIQRLAIAISMMLAIGASTSVARSCGAKNYEKMKSVIQNAIILAFALVLPIVILIAIFKDTIITRLGASTATFQYAYDYVSIIIIGSIFQCLTMIGNYVMMSLGDTKITLISTLIGVTNNIIIDYIFVVILSYGVKGAAFATILSQFLAFLYTFKRFLKVKRTYNLNIGFKLNKKICAEIIAIGFTTFVIESEDGIVVAVLNNLLRSHGGDFGIIILGIISKISMFMYITIIGISSSMQPIAAYNYGSGDYERLKEVVKKTIIAVISTSFITWMLALAFSQQIIGGFIKDEYIILEATKAFKIMIAAYPCLGLYYVILYYHQAIGKVRIAFWLSICKDILMLIPFSIIFIKVFNMGPLGVWISYPIADASVFCIAMILLQKWKIRINFKIEKNVVPISQVMQK